MENFRELEFNTIPDVTIDYDGNTRTTTDIGADEFDATVFLPIPPANTTIGTGISSSALRINHFVNEKSNIKVFPTFTNSIIYITLEDSKSETVSIIDLSGKLVITKNINTKDEIDVNFLPNSI